MISYELKDLIGDPAFIADVYSARGHNETSTEWS